MEGSESMVGLLASALRVAVPLIFGACGGMVSERSGVINIAIEGFMLVGAFFGAYFALTFHSPWLGLAGAMLVGAALGGLYGLMVIPGRGNQVVIGTAFNLLAVGLTPLLCKFIYETTNASPSLPAEERFDWAPLGLALALPLVLHFWFGYTRAGLRLGFAGAKPEALVTQGLRPKVIRWWAVTLGGSLAAAGGATLTVYLSSGFARNITAGRGFIALAAMILGRWRPLPVLAACLMFGLADAVQMRWQGQLWGGGGVPLQLVQILPYLVTMLVLVFWAGADQAPAALGKGEA